MIKRALLACALAATSIVAQAQPIDPINNRPVAIGTSNEPTLQSILDGVFGAGWGTAAGSQSPFGMFRTSAAAGQTIPTIVAEFARFSPLNKFGIWFATDASRVFSYDLLLGPATAGDFASLTLGSGILNVTGSACGTRVNCGTVSNALITPDRFGFFFQTSVLPRAYSVDALNLGGQARVLGYQGGATTWAFAYEDLTDRDYNDMVVRVDSIIPVPEASTIVMLLAGLGVIGVTALRRRRSGS